MVMKILIVLINSKIPALLYGGTERVMWYLGKELAGMGHQVSFLVKKGSVCDFAKIIDYNPEIPVGKQIPEDVDIVHFNDGVLDRSKPYVVTFHGNKVQDPIDQNAIFVSRNHAERHSSNSFVYNGLDWSDYGSLNISEPRTYFHFLGNAAWRIKNVRGCISMIRHMPGERLCVLGGHRLNFKMGFRFTLTPPPKVSFKGMVGGTKKVSFLQHSKGLLFPVLWDEPFGLAITESLYCGAPVFGTCHGSLPELVTKEVGFLSNEKATLVRHIMEDYHYSPRICHEYAGDCFNSRKMAEAYLEKYECVLNGRSLNETQPCALNSYEKYKFH